MTRPDNQLTTVHEQGPVHEPSARAAAAGGARILFAFRDDQRPGASLARAASLARELSAQLHVLMVVRPREPFAPIVPLSTNRSLVSRWLTDRLGGDSSFRLRVSGGRFLVDVADTARQLDAQVIVLPPQRLRRGRSVTKLVRRSGVPVLVARDAEGTRDRIVAATDLADRLYPVLRAAGRLGDQLHAPVIAVHNVNPFAAIIGANSVWPLALSPESLTAAEFTSRVRQLQLAAQETLNAESETTYVANRMKPVDAILGVAASQRADMVVVGAHARSWFGRLLSGEVAAQVVNRARCSVLVTPLRT